MAKEYKPGQFVSICGKLHRVKKVQGFEHPCAQCPYKRPHYIGKRIVCHDCTDKLLYKQYPIPLTQ